METMIKCLYLSLILFLIVWVATAEEITTENLLPNGTGNSSSYQNVDNSVPNVTTNGFNTTGNIRNWGQELETTGTGGINVTGSLVDITTGNDTTTQDKLNNGVTLNSTTIVQNCEYQGSNWQCGQAKPGQDTYTTTVSILDANGNVLATVNQVRNNDAGYGNNAYKYQDTVTYTGTGSNQFYWAWEGVDLGYDTYGTNLGGPNLLGAKLTMTYDNVVIQPEVIEEIEEVIDEFIEWEQAFIEPEIIEEFTITPIAFEELFLPVYEEEIAFEELETLEEEFEEVEILQVFGGPEIVEEPEEEVTEQAPTETVAAAEELMEEQPEQSESTQVEAVQEEPESEPQRPGDQLMEINVQDVTTQVAVKIKAIDKQLAVVNVIMSQSMVEKQVDISSYYKQYTDNRELYKGNVYEDLRILDGGEIYQNDNRFASISLNDPVREYQEKIQQNRLIRLQKEKELEVLRSQYAR